MRIAVLGGTGFIGSEVVKRLVAHGDDVLALQRGNVPSTLPETVTHASVDRMNADAVKTALQRFGAEVLVDILPMTLANTQPVLDAAKGTVRRYVGVSSVDVYRNYGGLIGKETPESASEALAEDAPLRDMRFPFRVEVEGEPSAQQAFFNDYDKIVVEEAARAQTGMEVTIVRLPMVYGPGDKQHRFKWMVEVARAGGPLELDSRAAEWRSSHGYVTDVAEAIALAARHPAAANRTYNAGEASAATTAAWLGRIAEALGSDLQIVLVPPEQKGALHQMAEGANLTFHLEASTERLRSELGFAEVTPADEALRHTIAWEDAFNPAPPPAQEARPAPAEETEKQASETEQA